MIILGLLCNFFTTKIAFLHPSDEGRIIIYHICNQMRSVIRNGLLTEPIMGFENSLTKEITKSIFVSRHPRDISTEWSINSCPFINQSIIITTLFYKIPPHLPFSKGGTIPLFGRRPIGPLARRAKRG
jgi:hypothetical protein